MFVLCDLCLRGPNIVETYKGSYRHRQCCYLCQALADVDTEDPDQDGQHSLLYTHWGREASYRSEFLAPTWLCQGRME